MICQAAPSYRRSGRGVGPLPSTQSSKCRLVRKYRQTRAETIRGSQRSTSPSNPFSRRDSVDTLISIASAMSFDVCPNERRSSRTRGPIASESTLARVSHPGTSVPRSSPSARSIRRILSADTPSPRSSRCTVRSETFALAASSALLKPRVSRAAVTLRCRSSGRAARDVRLFLGAMRQFCPNPCLGQVLQASIRKQGADCPQMTIGNGNDHGAGSRYHRRMRYVRQGQDDVDLCPRPWQWHHCRGR